MERSRLFPILLSIFLFSCLSFGQNGRNESTRTISRRANVFLNDKGELTTKDILQKRKMSNYDDGGSFDCSRLFLERLRTQGKVKDVCDENKIRDFIWQHWTNSHRSYIRVTYSSVDASGTFHIFIEPDKKGVWSVFWRIVRSSALPGSLPEITDVGKIVSVERIEDKPKIGEWALVFKNKLGEIVEKMPSF